MAMLLAGDIGGTKTILRLVTAERVEAQPLPVLTTLYEQTFPSQDFIDLVPMVRQFMTAAASQLGEVPQPHHACFGIAGPVTNNAVKLTNLSWFLEAKNLQEELHIEHIRLINDFAAIGYGVLGLSGNDVYPLQAGEPDRTAPIAVLGAGTGMGQGYAVPCREGYRVFATEGGHVDFAPRSAIEIQLLQYLKERMGIERVSLERVVSGMGILSIYQFMRDRRVADESSEVAEIYKIWQREIGRETKTVDLAAVISKHAIEQTDYLCQETMELFISAYGAEAGNVALKFLPYGGLYVAGGIAAKNLPLIQRGSFLESFHDKGRVSSILDKVPIYIVLNPRVGLIGAALCAAQMSFN